MPNKINESPPQAIEVPQENGVHIAGSDGAINSELPNTFNAHLAESRSAPWAKCTVGAVSSVGRAGASHASGREFETLTAHHFPSYKRFNSIWDAGFSEYFWKRVSVSEPGECWHWKASRNRDGYGQIRVNNRYHVASRVAYEIANGTPLNGKLALHKCDNPPCCNPAHLYAGTSSENVNDMISRGRVKPLKGERNHFAKMTAEQVEHVRALFQQGKSNVAIGQLLGVHHSTISKIRTGATWK